MMSVRLWRCVDDLCDMFEIPDNRARADFVGLVDVCAHFAARGSTVDLNGLVEELCGELHMSKLVYWSRLKRVAAPLLHADVRTLRELGVKINKQPTTTADLVRALVETVKDDDLYKEELGERA